MDLSDITAVVRPRNHWEAIDLGCLMVRRWWKTLYVAWLAITAPIFIALYVVLHDHPVIAMLIFWWLKPAYERLPLLIVSQALFGSVPRTRDALRAYIRLLPNQLFQALTIRRWVPTRSFDQPIAQLENLGGRERQRRLELLRRTAGSPAFWLTFVCVHVEMFLTLGALVLIFELIPNEVEVDWLSLIIAPDTSGLDWLSNLVYFMAISLVGPIYAVAGFSLYINRRIELEGWDIELDFRRLMRRLSGGFAHIAVLVCLVLTCAPAELLAASADDKASSKKTIEEVMRGPEFNHESVSHIPKAFEDWFAEEDDEATPASSSPDWVVEMFRVFAQSVEFVLWVLVISGAIWVVYRYRAWLGQFIDRRRTIDEAGERPSVMFGLNVSAHALGPQPLRSAEELWMRKQHREALSVLYRAALISLMDRHQCRLDASDTEGQCVERVRHDAPDAADRFSRLTTLWQSVAYAHRVPSDENFREMCRTWSTDLTTDP